MSYKMGKRKLGFEGVPWIENCNPQTVDDLAVQKKKVSEVEDWLRNCFKQQKKAPILLLTGPPGAGKTATVILLCKNLRAELFSWSNAESEYSQNGNADILNLNYERKWIKRENQVSQFSSFLLRCNKYSLFTDQKKVILVEEFPNAFLRDPTMFHNVIRKYATNGQHPLIFIISDNTKGESIESRLFPSDIKYALKVTNISFNPITNTKLMKVLNKINDAVQFESCYKKLSKPQLEDISASSMGDIRNAVNSLQFLSVSSFKKPKPLAPKKGSSVVKGKSQDNNRDSSLFLFHALGKILYSKRDPASKSEKDNLPSHMKHLERDPLVANAEDVFEKTSLSAEAFSLFLQENYPSFVNDINVSANCSFWFSEADLFSSFWNGQDSLGDYIASLSSRGLMYNLVPLGGANSWRPLHKPHFYDCAKKQTSLMASLKRSFRDKSATFRELQTELLPFMQKINCSGLRSDQASVISELGEMKVKRLFRPEYQALKEKEVPDLEIDDVEVTAIPNEDKSESLDPLQISDEEVVIEEYDF